MSKKRNITPCENCGASASYAQPSKEKLVIRCRGCGHTIYVYYNDPTHPDAPTPHSIEAALLAEVTPPARALYDGLCRYYRQYGYAPTLRELTAMLGWASTNSTRHHLAALEEVGLIERDYGAARGIRLLYVR